MKPHELRAKLGAAVKKVQAGKLSHEAVRELVSQARQTTQSLAASTTQGAPAASISERQYEAAMRAVSALMDLDPDPLPSSNVGRCLDELAQMCQAYEEENLPEDEKTIAEENFPIDVKRLEIDPLQ